MLFWILTMGGIAATDLTERDWFVKELRNLTKLLGLKSWQQYSGILKQGLWLAATNDEDGRDLWDETQSI